MKVAIYSRTSTDRQTHESQLQETREYAARRGWQNVVEFSDVSSGAKFTRKGLDEMMKLVRRGKLDVVLVFRLDRLGRSLSQLAQLIDELISHNVALVVPSQGIDTSNSNPAAKLQLNILLAVAEFEREIIRERVNAGLAAARARGVKLGRREKLKHYHAKALELDKLGMSGRKIAAELGIPAGSIGKLLRDAKKAAV